MKIENLKTGNVGKFISLYGLNDIFETLGDDMESIAIYGSKDDSIGPIEIPRSITRFKKLRQLVLNEGIISKVPDFICELKELSMIGFVDNPQLTSVPECLIELPDLEVLNMKGSPVKAPESFNEKLTSLGDNIWYSI